MLRGSFVSPGTCRAVSQLSKFILLFLIGLGAVTMAHGTYNLKWFETKRKQLLVGHLPVT